MTNKCKHGFIVGTCAVCQIDVNMTDAREIAKQYLAERKHSDKYKGDMPDAEYEELAVEWLEEKLSDAISKATESQLAALAAKDAEIQKSHGDCITLTEKLIDRDAKIEQQAAEIERLKKSEADDTLLFIAHNQQTNNLKEQIEKLQARVMELEDKLLSIDIQWDFYKQFLIEKYPPAAGEIWSFTCPYHQAIDALINHPGG